MAIKATAVLNYWALTNDELRDLWWERGLRGYSHLNKAALVAGLEQAAREAAVAQPTGGGTTVSEAAQRHFGPEPESTVGAATARAEATPAPVQPQMMESRTTPIAPYSEEGAREAHMAQVTETSREVAAARAEMPFTAPRESAWRWIDEPDYVPPLAAQTTPTPEQAVTQQEAAAERQAAGRALLQRAGITPTPLPRGQASPLVQRYGRLESQGLPTLPGPDAPALQSRLESILGDRVSTVPVKYRAYGDFVRVSIGTGGRRGYLDVTTGPGGSLAVRLASGSLAQITPYLQATYEEGTAVAQTTSPEQRLQGMVVSMARSLQKASGRFATPASRAREAAMSELGIQGAEEEKGGPIIHPMTWQHVSPAALQGMRAETVRVAGTDPRTFIEAYPRYYARGAMGTGRARSAMPYAALRHLQGIGSTAEGQPNVLPEHKRVRVMGAQEMAFLEGAAMYQSPFVMSPSSQRETTQIVPTRFVVGPEIGAGGGRISPRYQNIWAPWQKVHPLTGVTPSQLADIRLARPGTTQLRTGKGRVLFSAGDLTTDISKGREESQWAGRNVENIVVSLPATPEWEEFYQFLGPEQRGHFELTGGALDPTPVPAVVASGREWRPAGGTFSAKGQGMKALVGYGEQYPGGAYMPMPKSGTAFRAWTWGIATAMSATPEGREELEEAGIGVLPNMRQLWTTSHVRSMVPVIMKHYKESERTYYVSDWDIMDYRTGRIPGVTSIEEAGEGRYRVTRQERGFDLPFAYQFRTEWPYGQTQVSGEELNVIAATDPERFAQLMARGPKPLYTKTAEAYWRSTGVAKPYESALSLDQVREIWAGVAGGVETEGRPVGALVTTLARSLSEDSGQAIDLGEGRFLPGARWMMQLAGQEEQPVRTVARWERALQAAVEGEPTEAARRWSMYQSSMEELMLTKKFMRGLTSVPERGIYGPPTASSALPGNVMALGDDLLMEGLARILGRKPSTEDFSYAREAIARRGMKGTPEQWGGDITATRRPVSDPLRQLDVPVKLWTQGMSETFTGEPMGSSEMRVSPFIMELMRGDVDADLVQALLEPLFALDKEGHLATREPRRTHSKAEYLNRFLSGLSEAMPRRFGKFVRGARELLGQVGITPTPENLALASRAFPDVEWNERAKYLEELQGGKWANVLFAPGGGLRPLEEIQAGLGDMIGGISGRELGEQTRSNLVSKAMMGIVYNQFLRVTGAAARGIGRSSVLSALGNIYQKPLDLISYDPEHPMGGPKHLSRGAAQLSDLLGSYVMGAGYYQKQIGEWTAKTETEAPSAPWSSSGLIGTTGIIARAIGELTELSPEQRAGLIAPAGASGRDMKNLTREISFLESVLRRGQHEQEAFAINRLVRAWGGRGQVLTGSAPLFRAFQTYAFERLGRKLEEPERGPQRKQNIMAELGAFLGRAPKEEELEQWITQARHGLRAQQALWGSAREGMTAEMLGPLLFQSGAAGEALAARMGVKPQQYEPEPWKMPSFAQQGMGAETQAKAARAAQGEVVEVEPTEKSWIARVLGGAPTLANPVLGAGMNPREYVAFLQENEIDLLRTLEREGVRPGEIEAAAEWLGSRTISPSRLMQSLSPEEMDWALAGHREIATYFPEAEEFRRGKMMERTARGEEIRPEEFAPSPSGGGAPPQPPPGPRLDLSPLRRGEKEVGITGQIAGIPLKGRMDVFHLMEQTISELKSGRELRGSHRLQAAAYGLMAKAKYGKDFLVRLFHMPVTGGVPTREQAQLGLHAMRQEEVDVPGMEQELKVATVRTMVGERRVDLVASKIAEVVERVAMGEPGALEELAGVGLPTEIVKLIEAATPEANEAIERGEEAGGPLSRLTSVVQRKELTTAARKLAISKERQAAGQPAPVQGETIPLGVMAPPQAQAPAPQGPPRPGPRPSSERDVRSAMQGYAWDPIDVQSMLPYLASALHPERESGIPWDRPRAMANLIGQREYEILQDIREGRLTTKQGRSTQRLDKLWWALRRVSTAEQERYGAPLGELERRQTSQAEERRGEGAGGAPRRPRGAAPSPTEPGGNLVFQELWNAELPEPGYAADVGLAVAQGQISQVRAATIMEHRGVTVTPGISGAFQALGAVGRGLGVTRTPQELEERRELVSQAFQDVIAGAGAGGGGGAGPANPLEDLMGQFRNLSQSAEGLEDAWEKTRQREEQVVQEMERGPGARRMAVLEEQWDQILRARANIRRAPGLMEAMTPEAREAFLGMRMEALQGAGAPPAGGGGGLLGGIFGRQSLFGAGGPMAGGDVFMNRLLGYRGLLRMQRLWGMTGGAAMGQIPVAAQQEMAAMQATAAGMPLGQFPMTGGMPMQLMTYQAQQQRFRGGVGRAAYGAWGGLQQGATGEGLARLLGIAGPGVGLGLAGGALAGAIPGLSATGVGIPLAIGATIYGAMQYGHEAMADENRMAIALAEGPSSPDFAMAAVQAGLTVPRTMGGSAPGIPTTVPAGTPGLARGQRITRGNLAGLRGTEQVAATQYAIQQWAPEWMAPEAAGQALAQWRTFTPDATNVRAILQDPQFAAMALRGIEPQALAQTATQWGMGPMAWRDILGQQLAVLPPQAMQAEYVAGQWQPLMQMGMEPEEVRGLAFGPRRRQWVPEEGRYATVQGEPVLPQLDQLQQALLAQQGQLVFQGRMLGLPGIGEGMPGEGAAAEGWTQWIEQNAENIPQWQAQVGLGQRMQTAGFARPGIAQAMGTLGTRQNIQEAGRVWQGEPWAISRMAGNEQFKQTFTEAMVAGMTDPATKQAFTEAMGNVEALVDVSTGLRMGVARMPGMAGVMEQWRAGLPTGALAPYRGARRGEAQITQIAEEYGIRGVQAEERGYREEYQDFQFRQRGEQLQWQRVQQFGGEFQGFATRGTFAIQRELRDLGRMWEEWMQDWQEQNHQLQLSQFLENWQVQAERMPVQFQWQREDLAYRGAQQSLQYAWGQEDIQEQLRYATGRERRALMRQQQRQTIQYAMGMGQLEVQGERIDIREQWAQEDLQRQRRQFLERWQLQDDYNQHYRRNWEQRRVLQDELQLISEQNAQLNLGWSEERLAKDIELAEQLRTIQDAYAAITQRMEDAQGAATRMVNILTVGLANATTNAINFVNAANSLRGSEGAGVGQFLTGNDSNGTIYYNPLPTNPPSYNPLPTNPPPTNTPGVPDWAEDLPEYSYS